MKFTIPPYFKSAVQFILKGVNNKTPLPILKCVMVDSHDGRVTFTTTDLDVTLQRELVVGGCEEGACLVPAAWLKEVASVVSGGTWESTGDLITITDGMSRMSTETFPLDEYPVLPEFPTDLPATTLEPPDMIRLRAVSTMCADKNEPRGILTGVAVEGGRALATNGKIGAWCPLPGCQDAWIPQRVLGLLPTSVTGPIELRVQPSRSQLTGGSYTITWTNDSGRFPNMSEKLSVGPVLKKLFLTLDDLRGVDTLLKGLPSSNPDEFPRSYVVFEDEMLKITGKIQRELRLSGGVLGPWFFDPVLLRTAMALGRGGSGCTLNWRGPTVPGNLEGNPLYEVLIMGVKDKGKKEEEVDEPS